MRDLANTDVPSAFEIPMGMIEDAFRRLSRRVADMDQAQLEFTGEAGNVNSTAMHLAHLAMVDLEYLFIIKGTPVPDELLAEYGPIESESGTLPVVTGKSAAELLERYRRVIDMIRAYLTTQTDADALRELKIPWWQDTLTVRYLLWHMAGHSMYHQGQIARLQVEYQQRG